MASSMATKAAHHLLGQQADKMAPHDPFYEVYTDKKGRQRQRPREMPAGLTKKEAKILRKVRRRAHRLDKGFSIGGFRFGWTAIIGLIPFAGDIADASLGYGLVIRKCKQCDIPESLVDRMLFNQAVSTSVGFIPFAGDILIAVWKVNSRNSALLEDFLIARAKKRLEAGHDPSQQTAATTGASPAAGPNAAQTANSTTAPTTATTTTKKGKSGKDGSTVGGPQLSKAEEQQLLKDSKEKGYIDRRTGEKAGPLTTETAGADTATGAEYGSSGQADGTAATATATDGTGTQPGAGTGTAGPERKKSWWKR